MDQPFGQTGPVIDAAYYNALDIQSFAKDAGGTTCIPSGQDRNCTGRVIRKRHLKQYCRKTCSQSMILPCDRVMKCGSSHTEIKQ